MWFFVPRDRVIIAYGTSHRKMEKQNPSGLWIRVKVCKVRRMLLLLWMTRACYCQIQSLHA